MPCPRKQQNTEHVWQEPAFSTIFAHNNYGPLFLKPVFRSATNDPTLMDIDFSIDKQELIRNKVLKANGLCGSDTIDVSVRRQLKGNIFGFRKTR